MEAEFGVLVQLSFNLHEDPKDIFHHFALLLKVKCFLQRCGARVYRQGAVTARVGATRAEALRIVFVENETPLGGRYRPINDVVHDRTVIKPPAQPLRYQRQLERLSTDLNRENSLTHSRLSFFLLVLQPASVWASTILSHRYPARLTPRGVTRPVNSPRETRQHVFIQTPTYRLGNFSEQRCNEEFV